MLFDMNDHNIRKYLAKAEFGIERESLRVCSDGTLAQSPHPLGKNKNIDRDFCENQIEFISDVFNEPEQVIEQLLYLQKIVNGRLRENGEFLWAFSNPPKISGESEIPVAEYEGKLKNKSVYRHYLAQKYGKVKMLFSGVHLNFSFTYELVKNAFEQSGEINFTDFKNNLYLSLAERLTEYAWLVVYLMSASPVADSTIGTKSNIYSSVRCSEIGYWNYFTPVLDFNSLETLAEQGINHLELRVIDVNPLTPTGILPDDIKFIHLLILYLASLPKKSLTAKEQIKAISDIKTSAVFGNNEIRERAVNVLTDIRNFTEKNFPQYNDIIACQIKKTQKGNSYAEIVSERFGDNYMEKGLALAKEYRESVGYV